MTLDEFMTLDVPNRDSLIADKVMGWGVRRHEENCNCGEVGPDINRGEGWRLAYVAAWSPTTIIADAWEVVEHCAPNGWDFVIGNQGGTYRTRIDRCVMRDPKPGPRYIDITAPTMPLAICIAALRAVGAISD